MTPKEEKAYERGAKAFARQILAVCAHEIGGRDGGVAAHKVSRAQTVEALRSVCDDFGDNDWSDNEHLGDVIEKHLRRHLLEERARRLEAERLLLATWKETLAFIQWFARPKEYEREHGSRPEGDGLKKTELFLRKTGALEDEEPRRGNRR